MAPTQKRPGEKGPLEVFGSVGLLGTHLVSATAVGLALGWFLDDWLGTKPWLLLIFLALGIFEGFRNMWREAKKLQRREERRDAGLPDEHDRPLVFFRKEHFQKTVPEKDAPGPAGSGQNGSGTAKSSTASSPGDAGDAAPAEMQDERVDETQLLRLLRRELEEGKADPLVAQALLDVEARERRAEDARPDTTAKPSGTE